MPDWKKFKPGSVEIIILMAILTLWLIGATGHFRAIKDALFSPFSIFLAVVMLVEYLLLKGADHSDHYRRELELARAKRRDDLLAMREMETELVELRARLNTSLERRDDAALLAETAEKARESAEKALKALRGRI